MKAKIPDKLDKFELLLRNEGRKSYVVKKYVHDTRVFLDYLSGKPLTEQTAAEYKAHLLSKYVPATVKSMLGCVNTYLEFVGVKYKFVHSELSRSKDSPESMLTTTEYNRLLSAAKQLDSNRLYYIIETLCSSGLQISELKNITVEAVEYGRVDLERNHKARTVYLPAALCRHLKDYCRENEIYNGVVFLSRRGNPIDRTNVFRDIKKLCSAAQIDEQKLYPENLRRLYKQTKAEMEREIVEKMGLV